jgi:hypothetical protein
MTVTDLDTAAKYAGVSMNEIVYIYAKVTSDDGSVIREYMNKAYFATICDHDADFTVEEKTLTDTASQQYVTVDSTKKTITIPKGVAHSTTDDIKKLVDVSANCAHGDGTNSLTVTEPYTFGTDAEGNTTVTFSVTEAAIKAVCAGYGTSGSCTNSVTYTIKEVAPELELHWAVTEDSAENEIVLVYAKTKNQVKSLTGTTVYGANKYLNGADLQQLFKDAGVSDSEITLTINTSNGTYSYKPESDANFLSGQTVGDDSTVGQAQITFKEGTLNGQTDGWSYTNDNDDTNDNVYGTFTIANTKLAASLKNGQTTAVCDGITVAQPE